jgi:hypothetical protein
VEKIRKFGAWLKRNAERLILAVLLLVLVYRLYIVLNPGPFGEDEQQVAVAATEDVRPETPPPVPRDVGELEADVLERRNPFTVEAGEVGPEGDGPDAQDVGYELVRITPVWSDGEPRATLRNLRTNVENRYAVGDADEDFEVMSIDVAQGQVELYVHRLRDTVVLSL